MSIGHVEAAELREMLEAIKTDIRLESISDDAKRRILNGWAFTDAFELITRLEGGLVS